MVNIKPIENEAEESINKGDLFYNAHLGNYLKEFEAKDCALRKLLDMLDNDDGEIHYIYDENEYLDESDQVQLKKFKTYNSIEACKLTESLDYCIDYHALALGELFEYLDDLHEAYRALSNEVKGMKLKDLLTDLEYVKQNIYEDDPSYYDLLKVIVSAKACRKKFKKLGWACNEYSGDSFHLVPDTEYKDSLWVKYLKKLPLMKYIPRGIELPNWFRDYRTEKLIERMNPTDEEIYSKTLRRWAIQTCQL